jgi:hypothetical protein
MGKFKEMDLLRQEREAFDADYPMEPTPRAAMWIAWNSEDGFTLWDNEYAARLCTATNSIEWPVQYVMQKVNIQTQIVKDNLQPDVQVAPSIVDAYCAAWEQSFLADNPFDTVHLTDALKKHVEAGLKAALAKAPKKVQP